jgi:hypothetical protein
MIQMQCITCKHYIEGDKCLAFQKIPKNILIDGDVHDKVNAEQIGNFVYTSII